MGENNQIAVNSLAIAFVLGAIAFVLVLISFVGQVAKLLLGYDFTKLLRIFDLSLEMNFPTYFSVLLMIFISFLLALIALLTCKHKYPYVSKWVILSFGFLLMAYDEGFQVHEDLVGVARPLIGDGPLGFFYYAWVVPGIVLVCILFLFFFRFLYSLPAVPRFNFVIAAIVYLSGCIGFEMIGGRYEELYGYGRYNPLYGYEDFTYNMISTVEESLELAGLIFFVYALLEYLADNYKDVKFSFTPFTK